MLFAIPPAIGFGLLAALVTTLGLGAALLANRWVRAQTGTFAAFAAGSLICIVLLHLLPEALAASPRAPVFVLLGFAGAYLLNRGVLSFARGQRMQQLAGGITPMVAIGVHSFLDGAAYSVTFGVDWTTGMLTALGLIVHEAPEGIIVFTLLCAAGFSARHALVLSFLSAAVTTPLGAAIAHPFVERLSPAALGEAFSLTAGLLLYVGAGHLLPHVEREPARRALPALALGAFLAITAVRFHVHDDPTEAFVEQHGHHHFAPTAEQ